MKTNIQQQRVIIPVLAVVLIGLLVRLVTMLRGDDSPAPVIMSVQASSAPSSPARSLTMLPETSSRDPFFHPSLNRPQKAALSSDTDSRQPHGIVANPPSGDPQGAAWPMNLVSLAPIERMAVGMSPAMQQKRKFAPGLPLPPAAHHPGALATGTGTQPGAQGGPSQGNHSDPPSKSPEAALVARLKLTAILAGDRPSAVIEGYSTQPLIVHQGEAFGTLRVAAIHATEIVLSGPGSIWTLPLDTNAAGSAALAGTPKEDNAVATH
jgi:hypothetical protein